MKVGRGGVAQAAFTAASGCQAAPACQRVPRTVLCAALLFLFSLCLARLHSPMDATYFIGGDTVCLLRVCSSEFQHIKHIKQTRLHDY